MLISIMIITRSLEKRVGELVVGVAERVFDNLLIELRKGDRERDRVVNPTQLKVLILDKYKVRVKGLIDLLKILVLIY